MGKMIKRNTDEYKELKGSLEELAVEKEELQEAQKAHRRKAIEVIAKAKDTGMPITHIARYYRTMTMTIYRYLQK